MLRSGTGCTYMPIDLSASTLVETTGTLRIRYPELRIMPVHADITHEFRLPKHDGPVLFSLLGSTIGNFDEMHATRLLRRIRGHMQPPDSFLLGVDLRKSTRELEAAYNDLQGITARFNLNILQVLNRELGADFDLLAFSHRAFYDEHLHRIEMHLVSARDQVVMIPEMGGISLTRGETIRTEISCKYDRAAVEVLFEAAGSLSRNGTRTSTSASRWCSGGQGGLTLSSGGFAVRPSFVRFLFTVAAAISLDRLSERPCFRSDAFTCSYCLSSLLFHESGIVTS